LGQQGVKLYLSNKVSKYKLWGGGGAMAFKGVNVNKKHIKNHQEYIQSLMKFHLHGMLDINLATNVN
jgi:hypothetical protein